MSATVSKRGQVTIPKPVRERMGIEPGSAVEFEFNADGRVLLYKVAHPVPSRRFGGLRGRAAAGLSTDEVMRLTRGE